MAKQNTDDFMYRNPKDRYFFEPDTFYGNVFYKLRQDMINANTKEDIEEIMKIMEELEYPYFQISAHRSLSRFETKMTFFEKVYFRHCLGMITMQIVEKKSKLISLLDIDERRISLKEAFKELNQEEKEWYNLLITLQNKITFFRANK